VLTTDPDLWPGHVEKVLGVTEAWAEQYPQTHLALIKALLEACEYCDDPLHREEIWDGSVDPSTWVRTRSTPVQAGSMPTPGGMAVSPR
jgi:hypothetical protein